MQIIQTRRTFLAGAAVVGAAGLIGTATGARAEPPPETTKARFPVFPKLSDCQSPLYTATELLRAEGITDVQFVDAGSGPDSSDWIAHDEIDFDWNFPPSHLVNIDKGVPIKVLTGLHVGCLELIASDKVAGIPDLKGKVIAVDGNVTGYLLLNMMTAYVGLDPTKDFKVVASSDSVQLLADGKIDAFLGSPPQPQIARERKLGHLILSTAHDKPWSHYYCCMMASTADYAARHPIATKRIMRAILRSLDICAVDPQTVANDAVRYGYASSYALQTLTDARYDLWREYDPEDTLRFYGLRMQETHGIAMSPQEVIARGTDWHFLNELKREMKT